MTSSWNIARREYTETPINWGAFVTPEYKTCPVGYTTVPIQFQYEACVGECQQGTVIKDSPWKFCVPPKENCSRVCKTDTCRDSCGKLRTGLYRDNPQPSPQLYGLNIDELLQKDYFNIPVKYNTTGLDSNNYHFQGQNLSALYHKKIDRCRGLWEPTKLIQPYLPNP